MLIESVSYMAAFLAGILSFLSPCILPLVPGYFTFITGFSLEELTSGTRPDMRRKVIHATAAYVAGFSSVFVLLGASASFLGGLIFEHRTLLRTIGGVLIILLGLHLLGVVRIRALDHEKRIHTRSRPLHLLGTFLVGMAFAAGWSPCIGPLLGSILIVAGDQETVWNGMLLLALYAAGLALPFIVLSVFVHYLLLLVRRLAQALRVINLASGGLLVLVGLALITNTLMMLAPLP
jgi:cytochrome c-type biogenesis protein